MPGSVLVGGDAGAGPTAGAGDHGERAGHRAFAPCIINGGRPIEVDFGDEVMTTRIDGANYRRAVNYTLTCSGQSSNGLKLQVQGAASGFDGQLLRTSKDGLGIALLNGGRRWPVNQWLSFTYPAAPTPEAVPVKSASARLTAGEFTAGATMKVDYQ